MSWWGDVFTGGKNSLWSATFGSDPGADAERKRKELLNEQAGQSGRFADQSEAGYGQLGNEAATQRDYLGRLSRGEDSISAEQLRQGLQRNIGENQSMAAGASPQNAAGAARLGAILSSRQASGMSGNAALAGIAERQAAQQSLSNMIMQQRQQELQAALQSRQTAAQGYGAQNAGTPEKSWTEKYGSAIMGAFSAMSDRRLKEDIEDGDAPANKAVEGLRAYVYKYKDQQYGKGKRIGIMAQDLEEAGLGHAVVETPAGKAVNGAQLSTANTAMIAALGRRLGRLEARK